MSSIYYILNCTHDKNNRYYDICLPSNYDAWNAKSDACLNHETPTQRKKLSGNVPLSVMVPGNGIHAGSFPQLLASTGHNV